MKDPRTGAYGVIALGLTLAIKYQALLALCTQHTLAVAAAALVAAHCISRLAAVTVMFEQRYVRNDASARAKPAAKAASVAGYVVALGVGLVALLLLGAAGVPARALFGALAGAVAVRTYLAWLLLKRLGGYTGDCLGAVQQLSEIGFYLGLLAVWP
jgi:adenosylcobinamide-GDP ribazoletransferase